MIIRSIVEAARGLDNAPLERFIRSKRWLAFRVGIRDDFMNTIQNKFLCFRNFIIPCKTFVVLNKMRNLKFFFWWWICLFYAVSVIIPCPVQASVPEPIKMSPEINNGFLMQGERSDKMFVKASSDVLVAKHIDGIKERLMKIVTGEIKPFLVFIFSGNNTGEQGSDQNRENCYTDFFDQNLPLIVSVCASVFFFLVLPLVRRKPKRPDKRRE